MKMIRVIKSELNKETLDRMKMLSNEIETKDGISIIQDKITKQYSLFDTNKKDFVDDETYDDLPSAEKALEDYTEEYGSNLLQDLADDLLINIEDVKKVENELSKLSLGNSEYGKIDMEQLENISTEIGVSIEDIETIALELGYIVE